MAMVIVELIKYRFVGGKNQGQPSHHLIMRVLVVVIAAKVSHLVEGERRQILVASDEVRSG